MMPPAPAAPPRPDAANARDDRRRSAVAPHVVQRNIHALLARRRNEDRSRRLADRIADAVTKFTGSMTFVVLHLLFYGAWIACNLGWVPGVRRWDPSFVVLAMEASVEAIFLSTFVLISQNRMQAQADKRADLDLQISLLAEHEISHLIRLTTAMAQKIGLDTSRDPELPELAQDVAPEKVLDEMEQSARKFEAEGDAA